MTTQTPARSNLACSFQRLADGSLLVTRGDRVLGTVRVMMGSKGATWWVVGEKAYPRWPQAKRALEGK